jgi:hypothetical protein
MEKSNSAWLLGVAFVALVLALPATASPFNDGSHSRQLSPTVAMDGPVPRPKVVADSNWDGPVPRPKVVADSNWDGPVPRPKSSLRR